MPFKIKVIKFISSLLLAVFFIQNTTAQKVKIDAVGVVVGKNIVLDSDIEKFKLELENNSEGKIKISDCEMLEQLMLQKLLAHHAVVDSIVVSDAEVNSQVERNIQFFSQEYGSVETFRDKFKLLIKNRRDSLKLSDEYNWNREIAKLVGEILQLSKNY